MFAPYGSLSSQSEKPWREVVHFLPVYHKVQVSAEATAKADYLIREVVNLLFFMDKQEIVFSIHIYDCD
jgi:hypothetical protein